MDFLTKQVMVIADFPVVVWHVLVAVAALVLIVTLFVGLCQPKKKKSTPVQQTTDTTNDVEVDTDDQVDEVIVTIEEDCDDTDTTDDQPIDDDTTDDQPVEEPTDVADDTPTDEPADAPATPKKPTVKNYHISLRPDGKWQVKLSKGGKAIKLFRTQAEAIAFAKSRAKSQDGHITIHKVDGKIRKQKY